MESGRPGVELEAHDEHENGLMGDISSESCIEIPTGGRATGQPKCFRTRYAPRVQKIGKRGVA
jgi:hypothetical protein